MVIEEKIEIDPEICHGKPRIKGTRIIISIILEWLEAGKSFEEIMDAYPDLSKEAYNKAIETTAKLQEQYFENIKKAADYYFSMQKTMIDATNKMNVMTPDSIKSGFTSEAYKSVYDFWMKQFETLNKLMGIPIMPSLKESMESTSSMTESYMKGYEIYSKSYALWIDIIKKNMDFLSQNMIELQKTMTETYKGMMPMLVYGSW